MTDRIVPRPALRPHRNLTAVLRDMFAMRRQRHRLSDLSDETLEDIGITREQANREARRPAWDVPGHWRA
ncbi:MAG: DUF1127 domain-containing protein [Rhodobacteraceae bacterium]|nr:DUF1127 domain-containing protein [Paracoccaceae bacterium]